jgi:uncharacterized protein (TIGR03066 family)
LARLRPAGIIDAASQPARRRGRGAAHLRRKSPANPPRTNEEAEEMRTLICCTLAALLATCCGLSADDKEEKIDAKKLVGKWRPKEKKEGVIEFTKDGKVLITADDGGKTLTREGTYKLDGNKLALTLKQGDKERTMTRTVSKLTDTELVSADEKGKEDTLVRVKEKEKK